MISPRYQQDICYRGDDGSFYRCDFDIIDLEALEIALTAHKADCVGEEAVCGVDPESVSKVAL